MVKEAYGLLGWDGKKTEVHRKALSDIKDIATKNWDHPYRYIKDTVEQFNKDKQEKSILFIHSREPDEISRFVKSFGCKTLFIKNENIKRVTSNHADSNVENYQYDYMIDNSGSLDNLELLAKQFVNTILKGDQ